MLKMSIYIFNLILLLGVANSLHLPSYLIPCEKGDNFDDCARDHAQNALSSMVKGDSKFEIPSLTPLKLDLIEFQAGENFKLKFINSEIFGLQNIIFKRLHGDFKNNRIESDTEIDKVTIYGDYIVDGKISLLPIEGKGKANMTFINGKYFYNFQWAIQDNNNKKYAHINKSEAGFEVEKITFYLENLFGGDKVLGKEMNSLLNKKWKVITNDMRKSIENVIITVCDSVAGNYFNKVPVDELIL